MLHAALPERRQMPPRSRHWLIATSTTSAVWEHGRGCLGVLLAVQADAAAGTERRPCEQRNGIVHRVVWAARSRRQLACYTPLTTTLALEDCTSS